MPAEVPRMTCGSVKPCAVILVKGRDAERIQKVREGLVVSVEPMILVIHPIVGLPVSTRGESSGYTSVGFPNVTN